MLICDMDGTICESRQKISKEMKEALLDFDLVVISGASREQMEYQLDGLPCTILAQSGNDSPYWQNKLSDEEKQEIYDHVRKYGVFTGRNIEDRGCQIAYSAIGHHNDITLKKNYDPDHKIREAILKQHPFESETLTVRIAGTTCFDYVNKKGTKGDNLKRLMEEKNLKDCVYYGDALFPGGNDESVIGVMECVEVKDPSDLLNKLKDYGKRI